MSFGRPARPRGEPRTEAPVAGGRITAIESQAHDPERVNVFLDGAFGFGLGAMLSVDEGLRIGDEVTAERALELRAKDEVGKATTAALALLARRPRSRREVADRLKQKGYGAGAIEAALEKLAGWRYVDDAQFARFWVENREAHKPRGKRLLEQELRFKGVDRELVRETIAAAELDEAAAATELARAKLRSYAGLDPAVARRRLGSFLARRGYGFDVVKPVLDQVLGEADDEIGDGS